VISNKPESSCLCAPDALQEDGLVKPVLYGYLGFKQDEVILISDGTNDVSLLEAAGQSVAMQNSPLGLKSVADYILGDSAHSGFA
jgi:hydroxymethylpyrimidine pyrophosphatase-like HAD family hydrolase